ncbi:hypothetical protein GCM10009526_23690 [Glutamicibacter creatinolyticus]
MTVAECHICSCWDCDRAHTGPYKLLRGGWSDGVDRTERIDSRPCSSRYEVTTSKNSSHVWHESEPEVEFDTWAEAIAYADRAARTTKNGDNK